MLVTAMASTPAQKFVCPQCRTSFDQANRFCSGCGADMTHASPLEAAQRTEATAGPAIARAELPAGDRRLSDSNARWAGPRVDGRYRVLE